MENDKKMTIVLRNANERNRLRLVGCVNAGREDICLAPFCDYCKNWRKTKSVKELVAEWRMLKENTLKTALKWKDENGGKDRTCTQESVCRLIDEILDAFERAAKFEDAQRETNGGVE